MLREQPQVWGDVASDATAWRAFHEIDTTSLDSLATAVAQVRARLWDRFDRGGEVVIDVDATLVEIHSENKEEAAPHFKGGYGFHPVVATWDTTGEVLAAELRPGNAGANSAADQLDIVDRASRAVRDRASSAAARNPSRESATSRRNERSPTSRR